MRTSYGFGSAITANLLVTSLLLCFFSTAHAQNEERSVKKKEDEEIEKRYLNATTIAAAAAKAAGVELGQFDRLRSMPRKEGSPIRLDLAEYDFRADFASRRLSLIMRLSAFPYLIEQRLDKNRKQETRIIGLPNLADEQKAALLAVFQDEQRETERITTELLPNGIMEEMDFATSERIMSKLRSSLIPLHRKNAEAIQEILLPDQFSQLCKMVFQKVSRGVVQTPIICRELKFDSNQQLRIEEWNKKLVEHEINATRDGSLSKDEEFENIKIWHSCYNFLDEAQAKQLGYYTGRLRALDDTFENYLDRCSPTVRDVLVRASPFWAKHATKSQSK